MCHILLVTCHLSHVKCPMSHVTRYLIQVEKIICKKRIKKNENKKLKKKGGGFVFDGATQSSFNAF